MAGTIGRQIATIDPFDIGESVEDDDAVMQ